MQTKPTHDKTLIILMGVGAGILLLAALGLFLVQGLDEPQPGDELSLSSTITSTTTATPTQTPTATSTGTRHPTRTPVLMTDTPGPTETSVPASSPTTSPAATQPAPSVTPIPTNPPTATQAPAQPSATHTYTPLPPTATNSPEPTATTAATAATATLSPTPLANPILITGRVVDQDTPIANVTISLDGPTDHTTTTDAEGAYQFQVDWVDEMYYVDFILEANPQLDPSSDYVSWAYIEGYLEEYTEDGIELPDLEISSTPRGNHFEQISPANESSYSAEQITFENPLTFAWNPYPEAVQYWVDLGRQGEENTVWKSMSVMDETADFNGNLTDGTKISEGVYWWAVATLKTEHGFHLLAYTHKWTLEITP